ncbi:MAG: methyltransferase [Burkholderiaceae bacterium]
MSFQRRPMAARAFGCLARVSNALQAWPQRMTPAPFRLLQIGSAFWQSRVLNVAARLDLATVLGDSDLSAADLADKVDADSRALLRLLRMLAAIGVFDEVTPGTYRNNKLSSALRTDRADNVRAMVLMHNAPEMSLPWLEPLEQGIRTGEVPFRLQHGQDLYDYMDSHPAFDALFAQAMDRVDALTGDSFATEFDWQAFDRIIDVGGSKGAKSMAILKRHPHLQAVVVDRAQAVAGAADFWRERHGPDVAQALARMRFEVGDVLTVVPAAASPRDAYLLSAVLHGFDDATCVQALRTVARAAAVQGAALVLLEMVMPDHHADLTAASFDMQMFMGTRGCERTRGEWEHVFARSGVRLVEIVHLASFGKMLVLRPEQAA